jgi:hypothetical protein
MIKKVIKYEDYDGNPGELTAWFNLNKSECMDIDLLYEEEGGLINHLKNLFSNKINGEIPKKPAVDFIRMIIDRSYGVRPAENPQLFVKEDDDGKPLIRKFKGAPAYDTLVFSLFSGEESLDEFVNGVLPKIPNENMEEAKKKLREEGLGELVEAANNSGLREV